VSNTSPLTNTEVEILSDVALDSVGRKEVGFVRQLEVRTHGVTRRIGVCWAHSRCIIVRVPDGDNAKARESFVDTMAHELEHIVQGPRQRGKRSADREHGARREGAQALAYYREHRAEIDGRIDRVLQRTDVRSKATAAREHARAVASESPEARLAHVEGLLAKWETKLKVATRKVRNYRRSVHMRRRAMLDRERSV
jgi:hypothetical protein